MKRQRLWLGAAAALAGVVITLDLVGLVGPPAGWTVGAVTLAVVAALRAFDPAP